MVSKVQKTISREGSLGGVGIHSGGQSTVFFKPAPAGTGIQFFNRGSRVHSIRTDGDITSVFEGERQTSLKGEAGARDAGL